MEELRSAEILDKEIEADARKKAERILSKAEKECKNIADSVEGRIAEVKKEKKLKYEQQIFNFKKDKEAFLPLEKKRFLSAFIQSSIENALNKFLSLMSSKERLDILMYQMKKYEDVLKNKEFNVYIYGFDKETVKSCLEPLIKIVSYSETEFNKIIHEDECGIKIKEGIILESPDKQVRLRLTLTEIISRIQKEYRAEMYNALFGGRLEK